MATADSDFQQLNPYAPSAIPQPRVSVADGVGVWRDGPDIVMHPQATLPRFCIVTGEPARFGYPLRIAWSRRFDITPRNLSLLIPLSAQVHYLCRRRRWQAIGSAVAACALPTLACVGFDLTGVFGLAASGVAFFAAVLIFFYVYVQYTQFLYFASMEGDYLRLKGADERFLRRLAQWSA